MVGSLPEVHGTVPTERSTVLRRMLAFGGPAYLVSVGYMDPGNWATDLEGGARFGYRLLWVLVVSNLMAILLQTLSARLGIVTQSDLAQACRKSYPRAISIPLWVLCEIAIAACDLAEILDKIGYIIRERFKILGQVQALTGEGRISGVVLMALPIALFFVVYHLNPEYIMLLFTDALGRKMIAGAAVLQVLGAVCIKKIVNIKV